jgi:hypothetical protein
MKKTMYIEISYLSDEDTKREEQQKKKNIVEYLREIISYDLHQRHNLKIKEFKLASTIKN